jgi:hypothetical protein
MSKPRTIACQGCSMPLAPSALPGACPRCQVFVDAEGAVAHSAWGTHIGKYHEYQYNSKVPLNSYGAYRCLYCGYGEAHDFHRTPADDK